MFCDRCSTKHDSIHQNTIQIRHTVCIAHSINLIVKKSCDQVAQPTDIRKKTRQIGPYFRSSTTAKEKLAQVQQQLGRPLLKLINEVPTRWNSTYHMLSQINDQKEPVWLPLASLQTDFMPLTAEDYEVIEETPRVLAPFNLAKVELSEEKRVSGCLKSCTIHFTVMPPMLSTKPAKPHKKSCR